jgi:hypothetical protein
MPQLPLEPLGIDTLTDAHRIPAYTEGGHVPGAVLGNYFYIADKSGGVEPGFLAICIDEDEAFCEHVSKWPGFSGEATTENVKQWLQNNANKAEDIATAVDPKKPFTKYLIKQDYTSQDKQGRVTLPVARAKNSNTVKKWTPGILSGWVRRVVAKIYALRRRKPSSEENRNALLECIGNDIARAHGMQCQDQSVIFGTYPNGKLKILTRGTWDYDIKSLVDPLGALHGGVGNHGNYLSVGVAKETVRHSRLSDDSIDDLGEYLALMLTQGDVDAIGSRAQNKFQKDGKLFGLDFGHVYRGKNPAIASLRDDFSFSGAAHTLKNFSIFEDTPLKEKMKGIHYINKLLTGEDPSDEVMAEYGDAFKAKIEAITPKRDEQIFDDYINKLTELQTQALTNGHPALVKEYADLIIAVGKSKDYALAANRAILAKFQKRLSLTPTQLDMLDAFEKLTSKTSLTSLDDSVLLNHMRVTERVKWDMRVEGDGCVLTLGKPAGSNTVAIGELQRYLVAQKDAFPTIASLVKIDKKLGTVTFNEGNAKAVAEVFSEAAIQEYKHKAEVGARVQLRSKLSTPVRMVIETVSSTPSSTPQPQVSLAHVERPTMVSRAADIVQPVVVTTEPTRESIHGQTPQRQEEQPKIVSESPTRDHDKGSSIKLSIPEEQASLVQQTAQLQASFAARKLEGSGMVLLSPEQAFSRAVRSDAVKISIKNYSIAIDRYDEDAIRVGMKILCDIPSIKPEDIKITGAGLTQKQQATITGIQEHEIATVESATKAGDTREDDRRLGG